MTGPNYIFPNRNVRHVEPYNDDLLGRAIERGERIRSRYLSMRQLMIIRDGNLPNKILDNAWLSPEERSNQMWDIYNYYESYLDEKLDLLENIRSNQDVFAATCRGLLTMCERIEWGYLAAIEFMEQAGFPLIPSVPIKLGLADQFASCAYGKYVPGVPGTQKIVDVKFNIKPNFGTT